MRCYRFEAAANRADFVFRPAFARPVTNPVFVIGDFTAGQIPRVEIDGVTLSVNTGAGRQRRPTCPIDTERNELWLTLNRRLTAAARVSIGF